jgi:serine/threonine protein kinase
MLHAGPALSTADEDPVPHIFLPQLLNLCHVPCCHSHCNRLTASLLPFAVQAVAQQLLVAVAYMHELRLVHTDLKPENILLAAQDHMKLPAVPPAT